MNGQKLVKSASVDHVHLSRSLRYRDNELFRIFKSERLLFESKYPDFSLIVQGFGFVKSCF